MDRNEKIAVAASAVIAASLPTIAIIKKVRSKNAFSMRDLIKTVSVNANSLSN